MDMILHRFFFLLFVSIAITALSAFGRPEGFSLSGKVTTCGDNLPMGFGQMTLYQNEEFCQIVTADEDGCYLFADLEPGFYLLTYTYYQEVVYKADVEVRGYSTHDFCVRESSLKCR